MSTKSLPQKPRKSPVKCADCGKRLTRDELQINSDKPLCDDCLDFELRSRDSLDDALEASLA